MFIKCTRRILPCFFVMWLGPQPTTQNPIAAISVGSNAWDINTLQGIFFFFFFAAAMLWLTSMSIRHACCLCGFHLFLAWDDWFHSPTEERTAFIVCHLMNAAKKTRRIENNSACCRSKTKISSRKHWRFIWKASHAILFQPVWIWPDQSASFKEKGVVAMGGKKRKSTASL